MDRIDEAAIHDRTCITDISSSSPPDQSDALAARVAVLHTQVAGFVELKISPANTTEYTICNHYTPGEARRFAEQLAAAPDSGLAATLGPEIAPRIADELPTAADKATTHSFATAISDDIVDAYENDQLTDAEVIDW